VSERIYRVAFSAAARKQLARLDRPIQTRILKAIALLAAHPRPPAARKLVGQTDLWRIRTGDYRVIYRIEEATLVIAIATVGHRGSAYRHLDFN
jgi:mRNA interferase RelE/StbE